MLLVVSHDPKGYVFLCFFRGTYVMGTKSNSTTTPNFNPLLSHIGVIILNKYLL
jgi:hypothetical protein